RKIEMLQHLLPAVREVMPMQAFGHARPTRRIQSFGGKLQLVEERLDFRGAERERNDCVLPVEVLPECWILGSLTQHDRSPSSPLEEAQADFLLSDVRSGDQPTVGKKELGSTDRVGEVFPLLCRVFHFAPGGDVEDVV